MLGDAIVSKVYLKGYLRPICAIPPNNAIEQLDEDVDKFVKTVPLEPSLEVGEAKKTNGRSFIFHALNITDWNWELANSFEYLALIYLADANRMDALSTHKCIYLAFFGVIWWQR